MSKLRPLIEEPHVHPAESGVQPGTPIQVAQPPSPESQRPRLLDRVRDALRIRRYSLATEKAYVGWIRRYILFHNKRHPGETGDHEMTRFLTHLAVRSRVSASTQNQALAALLFLYREVLGRDVPWLDHVVRAKRPRRLPVVLTRQEVGEILPWMHGTPWLVAMVLYGAGLRLMECLRLRVKDVDFAMNQIVVRQGKGAQDRVTLLPLSIKEDLSRHLAYVHKQHTRDLATGWGWVELPGNLATKYPNAGREWGWQWVFPATRTYVARENGQRRRHHLHQTVIQRLPRSRVAGPYREAGHAALAAPQLCYPSS